jgi:hypothetical protein
MNEEPKMVKVSDVGISVYPNPVVSTVEIKLTDLTKETEARYKFPCPQEFLLMINASERTHDGRKSRTLSKTLDRRGKIKVDCNVS